MSFDSAFLLQVKENVTEKLRSMGSFIDEELPDYIMVMVANKKSESGMVKDLQLFLGDKTEEFTRWLHSLISERKPHSRDHPSESKTRIKKDSTHGKSKSKSIGKRKTSKHSYDDDTIGRSRSRSPLSYRKSEKDVTDVEPKSEKITLHNKRGHVSVAENKSFEQFDDLHSTALSPEREERRVVSTASLNRKSVKDSTNVRSIVQSPQQKQRSGQHTQAVGLLLKRAVCDVAANAVEGIGKVSRRQPQTPKRKAINRPVACSDVSSTTSSRTGDTKFYVTLSGASRDVVGTSSDLITDSLRSKRSYFDSLNDSRLIGTPRSLTGKPSAKERLGPMVLPAATTRATDSILLRQQSLPSNSLQYDDDGLFCEPAVEIGDDDYDLPDDSVEVTGSEIAPSTYLSPVRYPESSSAALKLSKARLIDQLGGKGKAPLVVSLNTETDDEEEEEKDATHYDMSRFVRTADQSLNHPRVTQHIKKQSTLSQLIAQEGSVLTDPDHVPSSLERCKFWPNCQVSNCAYIHPTKQCPSFPRCPMGSSCVYIHPPCRFGATCTRPDCKFTHFTPKRRPTIPSIRPSQIVCRFGNRCIQANCLYYHPPIPSPQTTSARTTATNVTTEPVTVSPIPCRYGALCADRSKCPFKHPVSFPKPDQLKWISPLTKQKLQSHQEQQLPTATVMESDNDGHLPNVVSQSEYDNRTLQQQPMEL